jgi:hypothetical protein
VLVLRVLVKQLTLAPSSLRFITLLKTLAALELSFGLFFFITNDI